MCLGNHRQTRPEHELEATTRDDNTATTPTCAPTASAGATIVEAGNACSAITSCIKRGRTAKRVEPSSQGQGNALADDLGTSLN